MDRKVIAGMMGEADECLQGTDVAPAPEGDLFERAWEQRSRNWSSPVSRLSMVHDIALVYLEGEIAIPEFHYLEDVIASLREKGIHKFVFSFSDVEHLNYRVFQELMRVAKRLRSLSGDLRFVGISPYLFHIFLFAGADQTIDHFGNIEEAILSFHNTHGRHWH